MVETMCYVSRKSSVLFYFHGWAGDMVLIFTFIVKCCQLKAVELTVLSCSKRIGFVYDSNAIFKTLLEKKLSQKWGGKRLSRIYIWVSFMFDASIKCLRQNRSLHSDSLAFKNNRKFWAQTQKISQRINVTMPIHSAICNCLGPINILMIMENIKKIVSENLWYIVYTHCSWNAALR